MSGPDIDQIVEQIRTALYGKDVRENIALGIEKTYDDNGQAISEMENQITDLENYILNAREYRSTAFYFERGALASSDGKTTSSTTRLRTGYLPRGIISVSVETGYKFMLFGYDSTGDYIGVWNGTSFEKSGSWKTETVFIPDTTVIYRVVFAYANDGSISTNTISNLIVISKTDEELNEAGVAADGNSVGVLLSSIKRFGSVDAYYPDKKYSPSSFTVAGVTFTDRDDGSWEIKGTASSDSYCDIFKAKPIEPGVYYIDMHGGSIRIRMYLNKSNGEYYTYTISKNGYINVPDDAISMDVRYMITDGTIYNTVVKYSMIKVAWSKYYEQGTVAPTGTDNTDEIMFCLNTFGYCHLKEGIYYTTGITMPNNAVIDGEGWNTIIELTGVVARNCIKMGSNCTVKNLQIRGNETPLSMPPPSSDGNRNGIVFDGTGISPKPNKGVIDGCWVHDFTGGAIRLQYTGYSSSGGLCISNCDLERNYCGIFIAEDSEYHKIANVSMTQNRYGCICNGANNFFSCCNFSSNINGFLMDNENKDKLNTAHGSVVGSTFMHNNNRSIILKGMVSGFVFDGCNIDGNMYGDGTFSVPLLFKNTTNVVFSGCNFMNWFEKIEVDGQGSTDNGETIGNMILFNGSSFRTEFTSVDVKNGAVGSQVIFNGCYYWNGTAVNPTII